MDASLMHAMNVLFSGVIEVVVVCGLVMVGFYKLLEYGTEEEA